MNTLERTGSRDALERFSLAIERLGPLLAAVLLIPSAVLLAGLGAASGYSLARGDEDAITLQIVGYLLMLLPLVVIVGPLLLPGSDRGNPVRLLLLPIERSTLYVAQCGGAMADPWHILTAPLVFCLPLGLFAGGAPLAGALAFGGGILLLVFLTGLGTLVTSAMHLLFRNRRRGELVALIFIVLIPLVGMLPALFAGAFGEAPIPEWAMRSGTTLLGMLPPQLYLGAAAEAAAGRYVTTLIRLSALAVVTAILHLVGFALFRRVLDSPATSGSRKPSRTRGLWTHKLPGLSPGASAVALTHLRLAIRTPRGRSILLSPVILFGFFTILMVAGSGRMDVGPFRFSSGLGLAAFAAFFSLMSVVPISQNQFAVDRAGLTMTLLSPLTDAELLTGKAVGNALIGLLPSLLCLAGALALFPGGSPALWLTIPIALVAIYLVVAPVSAIASAIFPKEVDLNTIGSNNAHGIAALMGMLSFVGGAVPPALLTLAAVRWLERPALAPLLVAAWCPIAYVGSRFGFTIARRIFQSRRENLATLRSD
jgi:hypothetical protein